MSRTKTVSAREVQEEIFDYFEEKYSDFRPWKWDFEKLGLLPFDYLSSEFARLCPQYA